MIEFLAGVVAALVAGALWRRRPHRHSAALDRRLAQVRQLPMSEAEVRRAADRIRRIRAAEHQRSDGLPPVA